MIQLSSIKSVNPVVHGPRHRLVGSAGYMKSFPSLGAAGLLAATIVSVPRLKAMHPTATVAVRPSCTVTVGPQHCQSN
jgi:hypothetical protein